jgi:hypothetical protein
MDDLERKMEDLERLEQLAEDLRAQADAEVCI